MSQQSPCSGTSETMDGQVDLSRVSRRSFVLAAGALGVGVATGVPQLSGAEAALEAVSTTTQQAGVSFTLNGQNRTIQIDTRISLLDVLREQLELTGTKKGCDHGQCGACTVLVDDRRVNSCLTLAATVDGCSIRTVEGLANGDVLSPVQEAFLKHDGFQCGYCTPGQICSATAALDEARKGQLSRISWSSGRTSSPELTEEEIRERMSGNLCRCGAYPNIVAAVRTAALGETA